MDSTDDPLDVLGIDSTDISDPASGGAVTTPDANPSNGLDASSLLSQLIGTAGASFIATQQQPTTVVAQPGTTVLPAALGGSAIPTSYLIIGAVVFAFALILRK